MERYYFTFGVGIDKPHRNCWLYTCFKGIENFSTNFALTCRSWKLK
ncbi:MAG: hypothetical protein SPG73_04055 [Sodaliphilus sp.]|nr:hypothetical protein [Sodaliphilus sp.]